MHFVVFLRIVVKSALCPKISDKASKRIDFPEPVSPVKIHNPEAKETSRSSIKEKFLMDNEVSTAIKSR